MKMAADREETSRDCYLGGALGKQDEHPQNVAGREVDSSKKVGAETLVVPAEPLFHDREGKTFWRCGWCAVEREYVSPGSYVKVANVVVAIVCTERCQGEAELSISENLARHRRFQAKERFEEKASREGGSTP